MLATVPPPVKQHQKACLRVHDQQAALAMGMTDEVQHRVLTVSKSPASETLLNRWHADVSDHMHASWSLGAMFSEGKVSSASLTPGGSGAGSPLLVHAHLPSPWPLPQSVHQPHRAHLPGCQLCQQPEPRQHHCRQAQLRRKAGLGGRGPSAGPAYRVIG